MGNQVLLLTITFFERHDILTKNQHKKHHRQGSFNSKSIKNLLYQLKTVDRK